jgi:hypothetical protein
MTNLALSGETQAVTCWDELPGLSPAEELEAIARELMTVTAMLRSAELRGEICSAETLARAKQALAAATADVRKAFRKACEPATLQDLAEGITSLIQSTSHSDPADGYSRALVVDVGSMQPSRGALDVACRRLGTTTMFRPSIPEVLAAVREAKILYETALRSLGELPDKIARGEAGQRLKRMSESR